MTTVDFSLNEGNQKTLLQELLSFNEMKTVRLQSNLHITQN